MGFLNFISIICRIISFENIIYIIINTIKSNLFEKANLNSDMR